MLIISFEKGILLGGYGDRVVGLISIYNISKTLGQDFGVLWNKENIDKYIDYSSFKVDENLQADETVNSIDNQTLLKNYLLHCDTFFPKQCYKIYLNQEISQYLFHNPKYSHLNFEKSIMESYKDLYTKILIPTEYIQNQINSIIPCKEQTIIGVQIRAGDLYMDTNPGEQYSPIKNPEITIREILKNVRNHIEHFYTEYKVFVTSDYSNIYGISKEIWNNESIIYFDQYIQHLDRNPSGDFSKVFLDNYVLSQYTKRMYISDYSNYGRIAALSSDSNEIFNLNCKELCKRSLISKHEIV